MTTLGERHTLVPVGVEGLYDVLRRCGKDWGLRMSTMGRRLDGHLAYFLAAAAARRHDAGAASSGV